MSQSKVNMALSQFSKKDYFVKKIENCFQGFFKMDRYHLKHKLFSGGETEFMTREIFERGDAVVMMPYDPVNDLVVMQEQFRPGAIRALENPWLLEFVAGMFGENESPVDVAVREAKEEANLDIDEEDVHFIQHYLSSPGGMSEAIHLYYGLLDASNAGGIYGLDEEHEDIKVHVLPRVEALKLLSEGKINNASTIIALQWLALNYQDLQVKWSNR